MIGIDDETRRRPDRCLILEKGQRQDPNSPIVDFDLLCLVFPCAAAPITNPLNSIPSFPQYPCEFIHNGCVSRTSVNEHRSTSINEHGEAQVNVSWKTKAQTCPDGSARSNLPVASAASQCSCSINGRCGCACEVSLSAMISIAYLLASRRQEFAGFPQAYRNSDEERLRVPHLTKRKEHSCTQA